MKSTKKCAACHDHEYHVSLYISHVSRDLVIAGLQLFVMCMSQLLHLSKGLFTMQESHGHPVRAIAFNSVDPECSNLFATVGGDQVSFLALDDAIFLCLL